MLCLHHIAGDAASFSIIGKQIVQLYAICAEGQAVTLPPLAVDYADYVRWESERLNSDKGERMAAYWRKQLAGDVPVLQLPTDHPRHAMQDFRGASLSFELPKALTLGLKNLALSENKTLFSVLLSAWQVLLHRYSNQPDIWIAIPTSMPRTQAGFKEIVGYLVNPMIVRSQYAEGDNITFKQLLKQTGQQLFTGLYHQPYPFTRLIQELKYQRNPGYPPLVQVMFTMGQKNPVPKTFSSGKYVAQRRNITTMEGQFDLTLFLSESNANTCLQGKWLYNSELFEAETIANMAEHFRVLLEGIVNNAAQPINHLLLLTAKETQQLISWNETDTDYPQDKTIIDLFEQQVENTPDNTAVVFEEQSLSYRQLNEKANQLAHYLLSLKTQNGAILLHNNPLIAIAVERSLEMIIGLLAILKAGGAYVPIDPEYPVARINYMLTDSAAPLLLTQNHLVQKLALAELKHECVVVCLDETELRHQTKQNPRVNTPVQDLAYVIYTSGSTGEPKGVMVRHDNLSHLLCDMQQRTQITATDKLLAVTTLSFDIAALEFYLPLVSGSMLHIANKVMVSDGLSLQHYLSHFEISFMQATPATWKLLKHRDWQSDKTLNILCGGEALSSELAHFLLKNSNNLWNVYGPTETTIWSSVYQIKAHLNGFISIGQPIANTRIYILDTHQKPQPIGIAGELCIAGSGLARGYLNRPKLTAEKFIEVDLFGKRERIYKTGDLARWLPDGNLEYLGRIDHQVKLRGFRIELGEIEAVLTQHPAIKEAVVSLYEADDNKRLVAYVVEDSEKKAEDSEWRDWLKSRLPEYMLPSSFTILEKLPLTPNGKIDRRALPALDNKVVSKNNLPRNAVEWQLFNIWKQILTVHSLGIDDNFFDLGGHSLLVIKLISYIQQQFSIHLPVSALFQHPTVASLAQQLHQDRLSNFSNIIPMQTAKNSLPIYCLPGAFGLTISLYPLASCLGQQQTFYALQTPGLDGSITPNSVKKLANYHLQALQQQQTTGPYQLIGYSSGGRVAFEMAYQLEQRGETVSLLAIVDTSAPDTNQANPMADYTELNYLSDIVQIFEKRIGTDLNLSLQYLQTLPNIETAYTKVMEIFSQQHSLFAPDTSIKELKALVNTYRITVQGHNDYQISEKVDCPIQLFRASEPTPNIEFEDNRKVWGWAECTHATVTEHWISGTHASMMSNPHVKALADKLSQYL